MLRNPRDLQCLAYLCVAPALAVFQWRADHFMPLAFLASCCFAVGISCVNHNHAHLPFWKNATLNRLTDTWIGLLQGHPTFLFKPAHIASHHRYNQGPEDVTRLSLSGNHNHLFGYLFFPAVALKGLSGLRARYLRELRTKNPRAYAKALVDYALQLALYATVFALDWRKALLFVLVPQLVGLHFLLASNYLQHAHARPHSEHNHARNFVGRALNAFLFNIGFHSAHHAWEAMHWSEIPQAHQRIVDRIDPRLIERSLLLYFARVYLLGLVIPKLRSQPLSPEST